MAIRFTAPWCAVDPRLMGWHTAFLRKGPDEGGARTSQMKIDKVLAPPSFEVSMELDSIDPTSATLLGQVGLSPSDEAAWRGSSGCTAPGSGAGAGGGVCRRPTRKT